MYSPRDSVQCSEVYIKFQFLGSAAIYTSGLQRAKKKQFGMFVPI